MGKNNVNKNHYIEPYGRERQGENIVQEIHKEKLRENEERVEENFAEEQEERNESD